MEKKYNGQKCEIKGVKKRNKKRHALGTRIHWTHALGTPDNPKPKLILIKNRVQIKNWIKLQPAPTSTGTYRHDGVLKHRKSKRHRTIKTYSMSCIHRKCQNIEKSSHRN
jgi:hypothetical protein